MIIIIDTGQCHLPDMWMAGGGGGYLIEKTPQDLGHRTKEFIRRSCVARLQVPRKVGEMALVSIDDSVNQARTHR